LAVGIAASAHEVRSLGRELMAPRTDHTTCIPSGVASTVTKNHAAKGSVFVNLRDTGNFKKWQELTWLWASPLLPTGIALACG